MILSYNPLTIVLHNFSVCRELSVVFRAFVNPTSTAFDISFFLCIPSPSVMSYIHRPLGNPLSFSLSLSRGLCEKHQ